MKVLNELAKVYHENLWKFPSVLNYLIKKRQLTKNILKDYMVGFCTDSIGRKHLKSVGLLQEAIESKLVNEDSDYFNGYITFPIKKKGSVVNMYGRNFYSTHPMHIFPVNSSKKILYNTDNVFEEVVIVESVIDCLTLIQNGFDSVALFGTNLSYSSANFFKDKNCYIVLDTDSAGVMGSVKITDRLIGIAKNIKVIELGRKVNKKCDVNSYFLIKNHQRASDNLRLMIKNSASIIKRYVPRYIPKVKKITEEDTVDIVALGRELFEGCDIYDKGDQLWIKCPHHNQGIETNRSLWVGGNKNIFNCFGCNLGGGPIRMVSWHLKITFTEAVSWIKTYMK